MAKSTQTHNVDVDNEAGSLLITKAADNWSSISRRPRSSSVPLKPDNFAVGYIYSSQMMSHFSPHGHPEQPLRIQQIWRTIVQDQLDKRMKWIPIREVLKDEALLVHSEDHWDKVIAIQHLSDQARADSEEYYEQMSLYVMPGTTRAALLSCGGVIEASLAVARNELKKTFAIVRPPGHHAEPDEHMGFCFFNNVAVATRVVQERTPLKKILILDWDVHHGNGTQRAFYDNPLVLYISLHRYEQGTFYPCGPYGSLISVGEGPGVGYTVNIPWPEKGMGDAEYIYAFQKVIMPIAMEFAPELVIISAGFDAAAGDELGECLVSPAGYAHMTHMLSGLAGGKLVVALEGGYNLDSISKSALAVTRVLLGQPPDELPPLEANESATETIWLVAREQSKYWKCLDPKACEPREDFEEISFSMPEILKAHRQHYMYKTHSLMQVPMMTPELEDRFSSQIMCTPDIFDNKTLVVFVHEFGNLRLELESSATCDANLERSYLIDFSKQLVSWIKEEGYSLLDANLYPKPAKIIPVRHKTIEDMAKDVLTYLWDNYIQLSNAQRIVFIGHGPGCKPLVDLVNHRTVSVIKVVKVFIQVLGLQKMPSCPQDTEDARAWYQKCSLVIVPSTHPIVGPIVKPRDIRRHGTIIPISETRQIKLIVRGIPAIKDFVKEQLSNYPLSNRTTRYP
ncbi:histone deacetylase complex protein [Pholiota conissans]|uniref:histone deacetylase n=1 Tax=Pholiota conissans TaxID=109636 RepID=A0A9P6CXN2_9AGAR|nr:histone deacetylase complex protein [Pholiota conissans]